MNINKHKVMSWEARALFVVVVDVDVVVVVVICFLRESNSNIRSTNLRVNQSSATWNIHFKEVI